MKYDAHRNNHLSFISKAWIYQVPPLLLCFVIMMGIQMRLKPWGKFSLTSLWPVSLAFLAPLAFMMWSTICMAGAERNVDLNAKTESQVVLSIQAMRKPGAKVAEQQGLKFLESSKYWSKEMLFVTHYCWASVKSENYSPRQWVNNFQSFKTTHRICWVNGWLGLRESLPLVDLNRKYIYQCLSNIWAQIIQIICKRKQLECESNSEISQRRILHSWFWK